MTTEIAVCNKLAIALAADSAATIGSGPNRKIYDTANKIFDISESQPFGLMIYNASEYMGLPFELLAKEFRTAIRGTTFRTVAECTDRFIRYLEQDVEIRPDDESRLVTTLAWQVLNESAIEVERDVIPKWVQSASPAAAPTAATLIQHINAHLGEKIRQLRAESPSPAFRGLDVAQVTAKFSAAVGQAMVLQYSYPRDAQTDQLLRERVVESIYRNPLSAIRSGVVIAGFGTNELCPSVRWIELDGAFDRKLKWRDGKTIAIDRGDNGAKIMAFAQDDIAEMFLTGLSPADQRFVEEYVTRQLTNLAGVAKQVVQAAVGVLPPTGAPDPLDQELARLVADFATVLRNKRDRSRARVEDMVRHMPVQELVVLAESLVEITSRKRRVTDELETVGGAVDVAAITRSEGLVWIKRKHYFDSDLNPRYFTRQGSQATRSKQNVAPASKRKRT